MRVNNIEYTGFDWDDGNIKKCEKHGMSLLEIESIFDSGPFVMEDHRHSDNEKRFLAVGITLTNKFAYVAYTIRKHSGKLKIRPISARYMHKREVSKYEKFKEKNK